MIYLDNAATSAYKPDSVLRSLYHSVRHSVNPTRSTYRAVEGTANMIYQCRKIIAEYFSAPDYEVAFSSGCTESLNLAILGRNYHEGCNVIATVYEHNSVLRPLYELQNRGYIELRIAQPDKDGYITTDSIGTLLDNKTELVVVNAVSNVTGIRQPIEDIGKLCYERNVDFLVDGAQAVGHTEIDLGQCHATYLAAPAHKGLNGIQGCGFLLFAPEKAPRPIRFGGTGTDSLNKLQPSTVPEGLESGTQNTPAIIALYHAIRWHIEHDEDIRRKLTGLNSALLYGIGKLKGVSTLSKSDSAIVTFVCNVDPAKVCDQLAYHGIVSRCGYHCAPLAHEYLGTLDSGAVRLSVGYDNTMSEISRVISTLDKILR